MRRGHRNRDRIASEGLPDIQSEIDLHGSVFLGYVCRRNLITEQILSREDVGFHAFVKAI